MAPPATSFLSNHRIVPLLISALLFVCFLIFLSISSNMRSALGSEPNVDRIYSAEVVNRFPHDPNAFTQGLLYGGNDTLFESTGLYGHSSVRRVALQTGEIRRFTNHMQDGWGLATDGKLLFGSDGTSTLYQIDPQTLKVIRKHTVKYKGGEVHNLNELEYVNGEVWANVWQTDCIARLSSQDGVVLDGRNRKRSAKCIVSKSLHNPYGPCSMDQRLLSRHGWDIEMSIGTPEKQVMYTDHQRSSNERIYDDTDNVAVVECVAVETGPVSRYTLMEIESATNGLAYENVIGSGDFGIVFHGLLMDNTRVAVKKLFSHRSGKRVFTREAEAMLLIRHRNLVKLLGYCAEGKYRMLVYEYVENGNLKQWLHQCQTGVSPLSWDIRMKIIIGIAKGFDILYLNLVPTFLVPSGIMQQLLRDVGLRCSRTQPSLSFRKCDVYSFGILIMEIVSGKNAIQATVNEIEEYLVDWVKYMVAEENYDTLIDPKLPELPSIKELKRVLLIALRCVDFEVEKRPKMGEIIHMLEPRDLLLADENFVNRQLLNIVP
ncbi:UNVERIFIED_CONTAM: putative serine/threonine-protein kinase [Sesamum calycinum]|uniref:non-specific serine/threonine protein kinase n=1 Tax=Sesamum calycinum TaxID=2727403 RepID=A0AAW2LQN7_9LAMI